MGRNALPEGTAREKTVGVAVSEAEREEWHQEAQLRGMKLAAMIREAVLEYLKNHRRSRRPRP